jgi:hypothetical protein
LYTKFWFWSNTGVLHQYSMFSPSNKHSCNVWFQLTQWFLRRLKCEKFTYNGRLVWFGLWCITPLSTIFQLYHGDQFYWWRKLEYPEKTTDMPTKAELDYRTLRDILNDTMMWSTLSVFSDMSVVFCCVLRQYNRHPQNNCNIVESRGKHTSP